MKAMTADRDDDVLSMISKVDDDDNQSVKNKRISMTVAIEKKEELSKNWLI
jgi:hypothetical protein